MKKLLVLCAVFFALITPAMAADPIAPFPSSGPDFGKIGETSSVKQRWKYNFPFGLEYRMNPNFGIGGYYTSVYGVSWMGASGTYYFNGEKNSWYGTAGVNIISGYGFSGIGFGLGGGHEWRWDNFYASVGISLSSAGTSGAGWGLGWYF